MRSTADSFVKLGIRCDNCGLEALARPPMDQPTFHVFNDGVLCDDCHLKGLGAGQR